MSIQKAVLRKELLFKRKTLTPPRIDETTLASCEEYLRAKVVFCYVPTRGEVDTLPLLNDILKTKTLLVPYCTDNDGNMIAVKISSLSELEQGRFGILEPTCPTPFPKDEIDVIITPGVAFSKDGYRLGYGKGYYDRFSSGLSAYKIGVCRKEFFLDSLPHDDFDIKMDTVVVL